MLSLVIGILTFVLVINSLMLILLVLVQLPKKEAGAGLAFGGATSDALFGAGSGTVLSRVTKYASGTFLALSLTLAILHNHQAKAEGRGVRRELQSKATAVAVTSASPSTNSAISLLPSSNLSVTLPKAVTNVPAGTAPKVGTNPVAPAAEVPGK